VYNFAAGVLSVSIVSGSNCEPGHAEDFAEKGSKKFPPTLNVKHKRLVSLYYP
jgi:hypothetical protein